MLYWLLYQVLFRYFSPFRIFRYLTFRTIFYTQEDAVSKRQYRLYRHTVGSSDPDTLVYEEPDEKFNKLHHAWLIYRRISPLSCLQEMEESHRENRTRSTPDRG